MCEMCEADTEIWCEPFPGWFLSRATKDGDILKSGQWCLVTTNYPSIWWDVKPIPDDDSMEWAHAFDAFSTEIKINSIDEAWELMQSAKQAGYNRVDDGSFQFWLFDFLGKCLKDRTEPDRPAEIT
jgi:hypothetical protein